MFRSMPGQCDAVCDEQAIAERTQTRQYRRALRVAGSYLLRVIVRTCRQKERRHSKRGTRFRASRSCVIIPRDILCSTLDLILSSPYKYIIGLCLDNPQTQMGLLGFISVNCTESLIHR